jgi:hypothetical protein
VHISSTCKVGQKLGVSLPLLTCSPSAWPSQLLYRRGQKSQRDLWITLYTWRYKWSCPCARRECTWGKHNIVPPTRNLGIKLRWVVSFTSWLFWPCRKSHQSLLNMRLGIPKCHCEHVWGKPLATARKQTTIPPSSSSTELPQLHYTQSKGQPDFGQESWSNLLCFLLIILSPLIFQMPYCLGGGGMVLHVLYASKYDIKKHVI